MSSLLSLYNHCIFLALSLLFPLLLTYLLYLNQCFIIQGLVAEFNKRVKELQDGLEILKSNTLNSSIQELQTKVTRQYFHMLLHVKVLSCQPVVI